MSLSIIVPFGGPPCEWRDRARAHVLAHWRAGFPDAEVIETQGAEPWSKGATLRGSVGVASGDLLVVADADCLVAPEAILEAVAAIRTRGFAWAVPHRFVWRQTRAATEAIYAGEPWSRTELDREQYTGVVGGGVVVLTREAWETVGGIDPRFVGWGGEDLAFGHALRAIVGEPWRGDADLIHLWHPHPEPSLKPGRDNDALLLRYLNARGRRLPMSILVGEHRGEEPECGQREREDQPRQDRGDPALV